MWSLSYPCLTSFLSFTGTLSGVIGVAVTGGILDRYGGSTKLGGWYQAHALAGILCLGAAVLFVKYARGERCFN
jgi:ACS family sodium-dependent inorganic phosphate cotransporter